MKILSLTRPRIGRLAALAGVALVGALASTSAARADALTFTADPGAGPPGTPIHVHSVTPCPGGTYVQFFLDTATGDPAGGFTTTLTVDPDGSWDGTLTDLAFSQPPGDYRIRPECLSTDGPVDYDPVPFTFLRETFTADPGAGPPGTPIHVHSVTPCPGGSYVQFFLDTATGDPAGGFTTTLTVDPDGSWDGTLTDLGFPQPPGDYRIRPRCLSTSEGQVDYDPVPFTIQAETFTVDPASGPVGTPIHVQSVAPCPGGTFVEFFLDTATGDPAGGFDEFALVGPDGSWETTLANIATPEPPGDYRIRAHCFSGTEGNVDYVPVAFTYTSLDSTPPVVTISLSGSPDGQNGWFVSAPVQGTVSADDSATGGSDIGSVDCGPLSLSTTGLGTTNASGMFSISHQGVTHVSCTATDSAGNTSTAVTKDVELDSVAPTLAPSVTPTPLLLHSSASAAANATDTTSGVASQSCGAVDTSTVGTHSLACTAADNAGNVGTASLDYVVGYQILGFFSPTPKSKWKVGQTVPVKVALGDANGVRISDAQAEGLLSPTCRVTLAATGAQAVVGCMRYDAVDHQFLLNWKLGQSTGQVTITVTVAYPGTSSTASLSGSITVTS